MKLERVGKKERKRQLEGSLSITWMRKTICFNWYFHSRSGISAKAF